MSKFEELAQTMFFSGGTISELLSSKGLELIEGKTTGDVVDAFSKGMKRGAGKFEREMLEAGIALKAVCRVSK